MLPAVMTLTGALSLTLALTGVLLLILRIQLPITLPRAGLPGATVGPAMLPAVMTLTGALSLTLALTGVLLLILRIQLPITLLISLTRALRKFRGRVTGNRDAMDSATYQDIRRSGTHGRDLESVLDAIGVDLGDMGVLSRPLAPIAHYPAHFPDPGPQEIQG